MERTLAVAKYLNILYKGENGIDMDQMRMHKMMYLIQRESIMYSDEPLFDAEFHGWKYGRVLGEVRSGSEYITGNMFSDVLLDLSEETKDLVKSVYQRYKNYSLWKLSSLLHREVSWKYTRNGLAAEDNGNALLRLADMRVDTARELLHRKNSRHSWR